MKYNPPALCGIAYLPRRVLSMLLKNITKKRQQKKRKYIEDIKSLSSLILGISWRFGERSKWKIKLKLLLLLLIIIITIFALALKLFGRQ